MSDQITAHVETGRGPLDRGNLINNRRNSEKLFVHVFRGTEWIGCIDRLKVQSYEQAIEMVMKGQGEK